MGIRELRKKYYNQLEFYEDESIIRAMEGSLNLPKNWDALPFDRYAAAILAYRGPDIWYFERLRVEGSDEPIDEGDLISQSDETENNYTAVRFPNGAINKEMEVYAWSLIHDKKLMARSVFSNHGQPTVGNTYMN